MESDSVKGIRSGDILELAHDTIFRRGALYGHYADNLSRIAGLWSIYLDKDITSDQVARLFALAKISRSMESPDHFDNDLDAVCYLAIAGELSQPDGRVPSEASDYGDLS